MRISYSSFDLFNRCPLQYKLSYIDHIKTPEKPELYFGGLIHEIVQFTLKKDPILPKEEELIEKLKNSWREDIFASPDEARQYFDFGVEMLRKFYTDWKPGLRNIVSTEKRFYVPLNEKHTLSGIIDRIDKLPFGALEVIDYKTSKTLPSQIEVDRDKQMATYNLAVESMWPDAKEIRLTLYYLKHDQKLTTTRRPDEVEEIKQELISTADKIEAETEFAPRLNPLCDWCGYQNICPLRKDKKERGSQSDERPPTKEEIDEIVDEYIELHDKISLLEPKIHNHFDSNKIERLYHQKGTLSRSSTKKFSIHKEK